jgi:hypothetical protein
MCITRCHEKLNVGVGKPDLCALVSTSNCVVCADLIKR